MRTVLIGFLVLTWSGLLAQQTVFSVMRGPEKLGDQEFEKGEYRNAIDFYKSSASKDPKNIEIMLKLAQCYSLVRDHQRCIEKYDAVAKAGGVLGRNDVYRYAEAMSAMKNYQAAIIWYKKYLEQDRDNELVSKKIWALSNIQFLFEDSAHYHVRPLYGLNTQAAELGAALVDEGIVFTSNRKGTRPVDLATDDPDGPFFELYINEWKVDTVSNEKTLLGNPARFARSLGFSHNCGPVAFYNSGKNMVFVASAQKPGKDGFRTSGLYFAELTGSKWNVTSSWEHNNDTWSVTDVSINSEGTRMFFSSNMKGGAGGRDLYESVLKDGHWSKPQNLGDVVNTRGDEVFPYLHRNGTLYFSSDGLPGMGGLDIFESIVKPNGYSEPANVGYPINSHGDDFGLIFDSLATRGYFSSNRVRGGADDDMYEFTMDLQTYPFQMNGVLRFKEHTWSDTLDIHVWPNTKISLVDTWQDSHLQETTTGDDGSFSLTVPYFSRYHILITDENGEVHKASLDLEKYRTETTRYEIVVVKDLFAGLKDQGEK